MARVFGSELNVGDAIEVGWRRRDTIIALRPYKGPLESIFPEGASLADFASGMGMTIEHSALFERVASQRAALAAGEA